MAITKAQYAGQMVQDRFFNDYRELVAHYSDVPAGIVSFLEMNFPDELVSLSNTLDTKLYRNLLSEALITLIDRQALTPTAELNDLAEKDLVGLRRETGIGAETLPPPPPKPLSPKEQLEQRVSSDWNTLKIADFKKNCANDRAYRETFERLSEENRLGGNTATSLQRAGA
jgi:hypothetical protein